MTQAKRQLLINMKYWDNTYFDIDGEETSLLSIIKETAELSLSKGIAIGHNNTYYNSGIMEVDTEAVSEEYDQFLKQLFTEQETQKP
jgi:hypothetical protein